MVEILLGGLVGSSLLDARHKKYPMFNTATTSLHQSPLPMELMSAAGTMAQYFLGKSLLRASFASCLFLGFGAYFASFMRKIIFSWKNIHPSLVHLSAEERRGEEL